VASASTSGAMLGNELRALLRRNASFIIASAGPIILAKPKQNAFLERPLRFSPAL
jgi:hypothetical protein